MNKVIVGSKISPVISVLSYFSPGVLACLDGYMNIALEQTEEYVNGQLKNKYGDAFIRGNNGNCFLVVVFRIRLCLLCEGAGGFYVMVRPLSFYLFVVLIS